VCILTLTNKDRVEHDIWPVITTENILINKPFIHSKFIPHLLHAENAKIIGVGKPQ